MASAFRFVNSAGVCGAGLEALEFRASAAGVFGWTSLSDIAFKAAGVCGAGAGALATESLLLLIAAGVLGTMGPDAMRAGVLGTISTVQLKSGSEDGGAVGDVFGVGLAKPAAERNFRLSVANAGLAGVCGCGGAWPAVCAAGVCSGETAARHGPGVCGPGMIAATAGVFGVTEAETGWT